MTQEEKDEAVILLENILSRICEATIDIEEEDTDLGLCVIPNFRYEPVFEFTEEEYKNLVPKSKYEEKCNEIKELQQLLMKANGHTCIYFNILSYVGEIYYDNCPLAHFDCGKRKEFSQ